MTGGERTSPPPLPRRDPRGHKGTFGTVAVVGGSDGGARMIGGPAISALAALRAGAGLARLAMPGSILNAGLTIAPGATGVALPAVEGGSALDASACAERLDEVIGSCDCVAIGPGFGVGDAQRALTLQAVNQEVCPVVVDADGLNNLAEAPELQRDFRAHAVLTPHPGEYRRLSDALGLGGDPVDPEKRPGAAERLARFLGCVVVLKGAGTVVSDGVRTWVDETEEAALATAGTGDALTGLIAGLVAQHHRRPVLAGERTITSERRGGLGLWDCAAIAVRAHAAAAEAWRESAVASGGMLATDLVERLPAALESLRA